MDEDQMTELRDLIAFLKENGISEFDMERPELKVRLKFAGTGDSAPSAAAMAEIARALTGLQSAAVPVAPASGASETSTLTSSIPVAAVAEEVLHEVRSPLVGTFYESSSPGAPAFVNPGDHVEVGQVLCIVEAMKLMNEIEADVAGEVVRRIASSGQPVEYGQSLFVIRPR